MATATSALLKRTTDPPLTDQQLRDAWDEEVRQGRAARDATPITDTTSIAARAASTFNDMREDAATGAVGYNRQWVPLLQSLKGKRFAGGGGLPTETYADPTHSGTMTLQPAKPYDVSTPRVTMPTVTTPRATMGGADPNADPTMLLDQDAWANNYAAKHPAATPPSATTPAAVLKQRATTPAKKPIGLPSPTFSMDALQQRAAAPVPASPSPPGDVFTAPMPDDQDTFLAKLYGKNPPPWYGGGS